MFTELIDCIRFEADHGKAQQERSRQSRARILDVAITIFARRGYSGASTREIADAAEVNQGLVTYYFGSKQALWRAAIDHALAEYRNTFADRMAELEDPEDRNFYRFALRHYVQWASENADVLRILISNNQADQEAAMWYGERHNRPFYDVWTMLLREGQAPAGIDAAMRGFGFAMGPFEMQDMAGLDIAFRIREAGLQVYLQPASRVVHHEGVSNGTDTGAGINAYQVRNA